MKIPATAARWLRRVKKEFSIGVSGNEVAAIVLCSGDDPTLEGQLTDGARRLEWENRLTVFLRPLEGEPRPPVPAPGTRLYRVRAEGVDRAGIVARICRTLADLAQLVYDCEANLEDSRMTILGNEFASILLCSGTEPDL